MMTPQEAYKKLDLARGLERERVEAQFEKLKIEISEKIRSKSTEKLKQLYTTRLDDIEEAYSVLIDYFEEVQNTTDLNKNTISRKSIEPDKLTTSSTFFSRSKLLIIAIPVLIAGCYFLIKSLISTPEIEAQELADEYCDCQGQNNAEFVRHLNDFINELDMHHNKDLVEVNKKLETLYNSYQANTLNKSISECYKNFNLKLEEAKAKYKDNTSEGAEFWSICQSKISQNKDLTTQNKEIKKLDSLAQIKKDQLFFDNESNLKSTKNKKNSKGTPINSNNENNEEKTRPVHVEQTDEWGDEDY
jgi:hypothetical protein